MSYFLGDHTEKPEQEILLNSDPLKRLLDDIMKACAECKMKQTSSDTKKTNSFPLSFICH